MGDFEFALVFYHRGYRLRPELHKFKLGIEKSQEAIVNCVGGECSSQAGWGRRGAPHLCKAPMGPATSISLLLPSCARWSLT